MLSLYGMALWDVLFLVHGVCSNCWKSNRNRLCCHDNISKNINNPISNILLWPAKQKRSQRNCASLRSGSYTGTCTDAMACEMHNIHGDQQLQVEENISNLCWNIQMVDFLISERPEKPRSRTPPLTCLFVNLSIWLAACNSLYLSIFLIVCLSLCCLTC